MRWEGLQGGDTLLWVVALSFREIGLQAWAGLIHRHGAAGPRRLSALQGRGAGGAGGGAGGLIDIGWAVPPERDVLALQRLQLEETFSNKLRGAVGKASCVSCSDPLYSITFQSWFPNIWYCDSTDCYCQHAYWPLIVQRSSFVLVVPMTES